MKHSAPNPCHIRGAIRSRRAGLVLAAGALALHLAAHAASAGVVLILDRQLRAQTVELISISGGKVTFSAATATGATSSETRSLPLASIAAIVEPGWWSDERISAGPDTDSAAIVELTDGRRVPGRLDVMADSSSESGEPPRDMLRWDSPELGRLEIRLDEVARIRLPSETARTPVPVEPPDDPIPVEELPPPTAGPRDVPSASAAYQPIRRQDRDTVTLQNGDTLTGLVDRIGSDVWITDKGSTIRTPASRVREVRLVNPPTPPRGTIIWLRSGAITRIEQIGTDPQRGLLLSIEPSPGKARQVFADPSAIRAIVPDAQRFVPLSSLKIVSQRPADGRIAGMEPARIETAGAAMGAGDIELTGPMTVDWSLPDGAAQLGGWLVLPLSCAHWGDFVVRIDTLDAAGKPTMLIQEPIATGRASVPVNAPIPTGAKSLRISIDAGPTGPIQDRLVLRRFVITR